MEFFKWSDWLTLREDNARIRAVKSALNGQRPPLPGSAATCPNTNPRAMKQAAKTGVVSSDSKTLIVRDPNKLDSKFKESHASKPDYSFDRWLKKATEFGDDVNKMVGHAEDDEQKIDKDLEDKKKSEKEDIKKPVIKTDVKTKSDVVNKPEDDEDKDVQSKKDDAWKSLKQTHKDRLKKSATDDSK